MMVSMANTVRLLGSPLSSAAAAGSAACCPEQPVRTKAASRMLIQCLMPSSPLFSQFFALLSAAFTASRMPPELKVAPLTVSTLALWAERIRLMMPLPSDQ